jgi:hypothetical protein
LFQRGLPFELGALSAAREFGAVEVAVGEHVPHQLQHRRQVFLEAGHAQRRPARRHAEDDRRGEPVGALAQRTGRVAGLDAEGDIGAAARDPGAPFASRETQLHGHQGDAVVFDQQAGGRGVDAPADGRRCRSDIHRGGRGAGGRERQRPDECGEERRAQQGAAAHVSALP